MNSNVQAHQRRCDANMRLIRSVVFFFNDTATTEIYTLSLHDALPIFMDNTHPTDSSYPALEVLPDGTIVATTYGHWTRDRKSTRLNSSHANISYAVFCLKKKY